MEFICETLFKYLIFVSKIRKWHMQKLSITLLKVIILCVLVLSLVFRTISVISSILVLLMCLCCGKIIRVWIVIPLFNWYWFSFHFLIMKVRRVSWPYRLRNHSLLKASHFCPKYLKLFQNRHENHPKYNVRQILLTKMRNRDVLHQVCAWNSMIELALLICSWYCMEVISELGPVAL